MEAFLKKYNIADLSQLHSYKIKHTGRDANKIKNPIVKQDDNYIMYCEKDTEVLLDDMALVNIAKFEEEMHNNTSFYKMVRISAGNAKGPDNQHSIGMWISTSAVTSITVSQQTLNYGPGTYVALYGMK
jgi:hypothetical protein